MWERCGWGALADLHRVLGCTDRGSRRFQIDSILLHIDDLDPFFQRPIPMMKEAKRRADAARKRQKRMLFLVFGLLVGLVAVLAWAALLLDRGIA